jgi:hypothetical protein
MKTETIVCLVVMVIFMFFSMYIAAQRNATREEIKSFKKEAVEKNYAEFLSDGETITFQWK